MSGTRQQAEQRAQEIVNGWVAGTALVGWMPGGSLLSAGADTVMIRQVADAFEVELFEMDSLKAHLAGIVGSAVGGVAAAELVGLVPVFGWAVKSATLATKANLIGQAVIGYFKERSPLA